MKKIPDLTWTPTWTSLVGCIHGSLQYLHAAPDLAWLFGGTGHAFLINMSRDGSCPSGPTAWITSRFNELGKNLGYSIQGVFGERSNPGFEDNKRQAWELARTSLDQDLPVIGWELAIPEFYVITGYDEVGYYYSGPGAEQGPCPKPWVELGESDIGMLEVFNLKAISPGDERTTVSEALDFAVAFNEGSPEWVLPDYCSGLEAYQVWIDAVISGNAMLMGHAYNAAVWEECRRNGVEFLRETKQRINDQDLEKVFQDAIHAYGEVARQLKDLTELYPFFENNRPEPLGKNSSSQKAALHLQAAQEAEKDGLGHLKHIAQELAA